uniref:Uncharacterized protein n=1 Tax=Arundo donax TaxID=35708 RepID=A0A0A8Y7Q3_ARUDO
MVQCVPQRKGNYKNIIFWANKMKDNVSPQTKKLLL